MLGMTYYNQGDFITASHYFSTYYNTYPRGTYTEQARFYSGKALFLDTPEPRLDQSSTYKAIQELQMFMEYFPASNRHQEAQQMIFDLQDKLVMKDYMAARLYYDLGSYTGNSSYSTTGNKLSGMYRYGSECFKGLSLYQVARRYFYPAFARKYDMAKENVATTDTLYRTGQERHKIAAISQADLLTLKLDAINARNTLQNADIALKRAMFSLASYLNFDKNTEIRLRLPSRPHDMDIPVDQALTLARENNPKFLEVRQEVLEAEQQVDKTKKETLFNASLNASIGFNQVATQFKEVYKNPLQQDLVSISISIPLIDWGVRKGKYNIAKSNLNVTQISARQTEVTLEEDVIMTVGDFNVQQNLIASAEEALDIAIMAYNETKQRFMIGKADINSLTLSLNRQQEAQRNYITALPKLLVELLQNT